MAKDDTLLTMLKSKTTREKAILHLLDNHKATIYKYVLGTGGTSEQAEETAVSALVITVRNVDQGRFKEQSQLSTYYVGVGKNLWRTELRQSNRESIRLENEAELGFAPDFQEEMDRRKRLKRLESCIAGLGKVCEPLMRMWKLSEPSMGWPEIAENLGFSSVQVAKNKGQRCLKNLKDCMLKAA